MEFASYAFEDVDIVHGAVGVKVHFAGRLLAQDGILPFIQDRPGHAKKGDGSLL